MTDDEISDIVSAIEKFNEYDKKAVGAIVDHIADCCVEYIMSQPVDSLFGDQEATTMFTEFSLQDHAYIDWWLYDNWFITKWWEHRGATV